MRLRLACALLLAVAACHRKPKGPAPPPVVHIRRTAPVVGERFTYAIDDSLRIVLTDGTNTLDASEENASQAEEIVEVVNGEVAMQRTIRFIAFRHKPLASDVALAAPVVGKTYRVRSQNGARVFEGATGAITDDERAALEAYVRRDTGEPDLPTHLLTNRDYERGTPWEIPPDQPAPFARGMHAGASITLSEIDESRALFSITQVMILPGKDHVPMTLEGGIVMDIASARILSIDVEGHITKPTGSVKEAHMTSHQTFTHPR